MKSCIIRAFARCGGVAGLALALALSAAPAMGDAMKSDEQRVVGLIRWAVTTTATGSPGAVKTSRRICGEVRSAAEELSRRRRAEVGASRVSSADVVYPRNAESHTPVTVEAGLAFCDALLDNKALPDWAAAAVVDGPGAQRISFGAALESARPHLTRTAPLVVATSSPEKDSAVSNPAPPAQRRLSLEMAGGLSAPLTNVNSVYGTAPSLRLGLAFSGSSWSIAAHVAGFLAPMQATVYDTPRESVFGFVGLDLEPMFPLTSGPVVISAGVRLAGGMIGRQLAGVAGVPGDTQGTPFGFVGPAFRLDLRLGSFAPHLAVAPGVALIDADGAPRLHGHFGVWLGFGKDLSRF